MPPIYQLQSSLPPHPWADRTPQTCKHRHVYIVPQNRENQRVQDAAIISPSLMIGWWNMPSIAYLIGLPTSKYGDTYTMPGSAVLDSSGRSPSTIQSSDWWQHVSSTISFHKEMILTLSRAQGFFLTHFLSVSIIIYEFAWTVIY